MKYYNFFYKLYGLQPIIKPRKDDNVKEIVFKIDDSDAVRDNYIYKDTLWYHNIVVQYIINYIYMFFVFSLLAWPCLYTVIKAIIEKDVGYFFNSMFIYMYLFQYIFGVILYNKSSIYASYRDLDSYDKYILYCKVGALIISVSLTALSIVFPLEGISTSVYYNTYDGLSTWGKILLILLVSLGHFYSYSIFFTNLITFGVIFCNHSMILKTFKNNLENIMDNDNNNITVRNIIEDYTEIRSAHSSSVDKMNNIFSSITVLGIIGCYFTIIYFGSEFIGAFTYIDIACFAIVEIIYIIIINRIKCRISGMKDFVNSYFFMRKFLDKTRVSTIKGDIYDNYNLKNIKDDIFDDDISSPQGITPKDINESIFQKTETILGDHDNQYRTKRLQYNEYLLKLKTHPKSKVKDKKINEKVNINKSIQASPVTNVKNNDVYQDKSTNVPKLKLDLNKKEKSKSSKGNVLTSFVKPQLNHHKKQTNLNTNTILQSTQLITRLNSGLIINTSDNNITESSEDEDNNIEIEMEVVIDGEKDNFAKLDNKFELNIEDEENNYNELDELVGNTCYGSYNGSTSHTNNTDSFNESNHNNKNQPVSRRGESYYDNEFNKIKRSTLKMDKKIDVIKHMCYGNTINSGQNSGQLDWIILYEKLSEPWEYFKVLGFEFDDVTLVQKFIVIIFGFLGLIGLSDELGII